MKTIRIFSKFFDKFWNFKLWGQLTPLPHNKAVPDFIPSLFNSLYLSIVACQKEVENKCFWFTLQYFFPFQMSPNKMNFSTKVLWYKMLFFFCWWQAECASIYTKTKGASHIRIESMAKLWELRSHESHNVLLVEFAKHCFVVLWRCLW